LALTFQRKSGIHYSIRKRALGLQPTCKQRQMGQGSKRHVENIELSDGAGSVEQYVVD
jgi:hypothetical protein